MLPNSNHKFALRCVNLKKSFGGSTAVNSLNLNVRSGEFYAFLGRNGAGKTTTLKLVSGLLLPDSGESFIYDISMQGDPSRAKVPLAYIPDDPFLYNKLRPMEYIEFVSGLWGMPPERAQKIAMDLVEKLGLQAKLGDYIETLSRGTKQKLALVAALVHQPRLMLLDEPLTGLDAASVKIVKDILVDFVATGGAVILTTHILEIAERMADRIGIIENGILVAEGTLSELLHFGNCTNLENLFLRLTATQ
jgi:ABC-2 type transport system ATP-binding protein